MFYSQFILAKKGPLGTIWIAAHLERKLRKNQVADTDIGVSVDTIISPDVPIALRLSSHLLLGVVRIYSRKVNYLFDDCSEALLKVKQAFRSAAVDLPPEESKAPYHSITMPETFDLDDFELPDNDILQGNFVDHHISSREQITLQDTMEGVSYSTSKFGLDERFGDGDASGLDLDEELFFENIRTARQVDESADPQASVVSIAAVKIDELSETAAVNSGTMVVGIDNHDDLVDYAQAPCTPGLVEEPNLCKVSACDDHLESEYQLVESSLTENAKENTNEGRHEVDWYSRDNSNFDATTVLLSEENGHKVQGDSLLEAKTEHAPVEGISFESNPASGLLDHVELLIHASDVPSEEGLQKKSVNKDDDSSLLDKRFDDEVGLEKDASEISGVTISCQQVSVGASANDQGLHGIEVSISDEISIDQEKFGADISHMNLKKQEKFVPHGTDTECHEPMNSIPLNVSVNEKVEASGTLFLRPCNSTIEQPDMTTPGCGMSPDIYLQFDAAVLESRGKEETARLGEVGNITENSGEILKENHGQESELLEPEKLMSATESHLDENRTLVVHDSPGELVALDEGDDGSKIVSGKKRSFTESTLTEHSLNSAESSRLVRFKRTVESVPDDDDLLSSILVGRSSVLKVKPTPRLSEVTSMKRTRSTPRTGAPKRKVLMDDTMVLHGDTIRQQLMDTQDIRRIRKKAPCTRPEISMIEKQYLEDEIFLEPIFSGMCTELLSLHSQMRDLSGIIVCKNNQDGDSAEIMMNPILSSGNDEKGQSVGIVNEPILASQDVKRADSFSSAAEPHLTSQNAENGATRDTENIYKELNTIEHNGEWITNELLLETDQDLAEALGSHLLSNNRIHEVELITDSYVSKEPTNPTDNPEATTNPTDNPEAIFLEQDLPLEATGVEVNHKNEYEVNSSFISETSDIKTSVHVDPVIPTDGKKDATFEFDSSLMDVDNVQAITADELEGKDGDINAIFETEPVIVDDLQSDVACDGTAVELLSNSKNRELEYNEHSEIHSVLSGQDASFSYPGQAGLQQDGFMENAGNTEQSGSYQYSMVGAEGSGIDLHDQEVYKYSPAGINTEFLNFDDDDELTDIADDPLPDDQDAKFAENTGWSSRTRAVSKYLQTLFVKEAECGRKSLSTDSLLCGKSRKEASRMFFETLVLKTRDYIHVEQQTPFGDITIQPRMRLMKSDF